MPETEIATRLSSYFGGFEARELAPAETTADTYTDIALSRVGVCRHRAMAFVITAAATGLRAGRGAWWAAAPNGSALAGASGRGGAAAGARDGGQGGREPPERCREGSGWPLGLPESSNRGCLST